VAIEDRVVQFLVGFKEKPSVPNPANVIISIRNT